MYLFSRLPTNKVGYVVIMLCSERLCQWWWHAGVAAVACNMAGGK